MREFNTTALCIPSDHYMVNLSERITEIIRLVDKGKYFTINRARQYGKTTTLAALRNELISRYVIISMSFAGIGHAGFSDEHSFVREFCRLLRRELRREPRIPDAITEEINTLFRNAHNTLGDLFDVLFEWCEETDVPIVLIIDEVDAATNNQVFLDFLAQLRDGYINRYAKGTKTFQSVILAAVTDVKHLKAKIRPEEGAKENSPWNIATDFTVDMSLSETGIKGMLDEYETDHDTGMDTEAIAKSIREWTNGYPFLVSRICQLIDEKVSETMGTVRAWTLRGVNEAVRLILSEKNTLFQSLTKNLNNYPELKTAIRNILMKGTTLTWNPDQEDIVRLQMYGLIRNDHNTVRIDNRIFETRLYNLFLSEEERKNGVFSDKGDFSKNQFVTGGTLNMRLVMEGFIKTYTEIFGPLKNHFKERDGREQFLLYLKPIINGTGNYYIEAQTRDQTRTDVVVDYLGQQYIIELKIWHGQRYNEEGERQLSQYLDYWGLDTGYMLSFNFNKKKEQGVHPVRVGDKLLWEGTL